MAGRSGCARAHAKAPPAEAKGAVRDVDGQAGASVRPEILPPHNGT